MELKQCRRCGLDKPLDEFYEQPKGHDGRMAECKLCFRSRPRNTARERANLQSWRLRHPGAANRQAARYRARHHIERRAVNHQRRSMNQQMIPDDLAYMAALVGDPCVYCGASSEHIDHIDPLINSHDPHWWNLTSACRYCNQSKGSKTLLLYLLDR